MEREIQKSRKESLHDISQRGIFYRISCCRKKEREAVESVLSEFSAEIRDIYRQTKTGNEQKWLMIDLEDKDKMYADTLRLIGIRRG